MSLDTYKGGQSAPGDCLLREGIGSAAGGRRQRRQRRFWEEPYLGPADALPPGVKAEDTVVLAKLTVGANGAVTKNDAERVYAGFRTQGALRCTSGLGQKLHLYSTGETFGIGVQSWTQYFRSEGNFAWYKGGKHHLGICNPGEGGQTLMVIQNTNVGIGSMGWRDRRGSWRLLSQPTMPPPQRWW